MTTNAGKAAVRCTSIDMAGLAAMEKHGKRLDKTSKQRVIRGASPLVYGSLDLRPAYDKHMKGIKLNKAASKPVLHFIVRFPPDLFDRDKIGKFQGSKIDRQKMMLAQAVAFINQSHGGSAVFAARVDRDEVGETIVDVFAVPRYEKRTKRTPADAPGEMWASATKFGKELAEKHSEEIRRRHSGAKQGKLTGPRMVGIALQSSFAVWFQRVNGIALAPKVEKGDSMPDRLEKEAHDRIERRADIQGRWDARRSRRLDARADQLTADTTQLNLDRVDLEDDRVDLERREVAIERKMNLIKLMERVIMRAVSTIRDILGLPIGADLTEDIKSISDKVDDLFAEDPRPEPSDDDRPGF